jgi:hypothetical protein
LKRSFVHSIEKEAFSDPFQSASSFSAVRAASKQATQNATSAIPALTLFQPFLFAVLPLLGNPPLVVACKWANITSRAARIGCKNLALRCSQAGDFQLRLCNATAGSAYKALVISMYFRVVALSYPGYHLLR